MPGGSRLCFDPVQISTNILCSNYINFKGIVNYNPSKGALTHYPQVGGGTACGSRALSAGDRLSSSVQLRGINPSAFSKRIEMQNSSLTNQRQINSRNLSSNRCTKVSHVANTYNKGKYIHEQNYAKHWLQQFPMTNLAS